MKKIVKYFLISILAFVSLCNVNATTILAKDEIDFDGQVVKYNSNTDSFDLVTTSNVTLKYYDVQIADSDTYNSLIGAYNNYKDNPTDENKTLLYSELVLNSNIDETAWSSVPLNSYTAGSTYLKWVQVTDNETSSVTYSFGIYKDASTSIITTDDEVNPDTGFNTLYLIPVMVVLGSVLVFKKRRYE